MFLDCARSVGHGKVRGPKCSAGPGAFSHLILLSYNTVLYCTPLLITVVARRSPKGMEYNVGTGDGDRK